ncbi:GntR family transcriptional regulator [Arthrobacter sp. NtRootA1]|uniref:GntR family transcriptional regulator n=1 Tax=Micrococcaceae TaxID=1268 RepID=UPI001CC4AE82|nr:GntR family transcriptional regulator [Arthrobacter sp. NtRootA1]BCW06422.1 putative transcriptional regulator, GntR family protein [Arthrobacter sp. NtRootA1]
MEATSAAERAYQAIRDRILEGVHQPGDMLGEASVAMTLGVSRTPVRIALARLKDEGWVAIYPKRGALVQGLSGRQTAEHADARLVLEATAVGRVDPQRREEFADQLDASIAEQLTAFQSRDVRRFIDLTLAFHRGFVEAGGSEVFLELYDRLADRHRYLLFSVGDRLLMRCEEIIKEHRTLTAQLRSGDVEAFATTLRGHIAETAETAGPTLALGGLLAATPDTRD